MSRKKSKPSAGNKIRIKQPTVPVVCELCEYVTTSEIDNANKRLISYSGNICDVCQCLDYPIMFSYHPANRHKPANHKKGKNDLRLFDCIFMFLMQRATDPMTTEPLFLIHPKNCRIAKNSIDRLNSERDYSRFNTMITTVRENTGKNNAPLHEIITHTNMKRSILPKAKKQIIENLTFLQNPDGLFSADPSKKYQNTEIDRKWVYSQLQEVRAEFQMLFPRKRLLDVDKVFIHLMKLFDHIKKAQDAGNPAVLGFGKWRQEFIATIPKNYFNRTCNYRSLKSNRKFKASYVHQSVQPQPQPSVASSAALQIVLHSSGTTPQIQLGKSLH